MQKFSVQEAFKFGWDTFKKNPAFLIGVVLVLFVVSYIPQWIVNMMTDYGRVANPLAFVVVLIGYAIQFIVSMGLVKITITLARGGKPEWDDLYKYYPKLLNYFIATVLYWIMVVIGLILFIIPGIYLAIRYGFYPYLIVDKNLGAVEALKESAVLTKGSMWNLFLLCVVTLAALLIGTILFFVGLLVAAPIVFVASGYVYNKLAR